MILDSGAYALAVDLIAIMLAVSGIVLGLGIALEERKLKDFGRTELQQALLNGAIVGMLMLSLGGNGIVSALSNGIVQNAQLGATCQGFMSSNYALCFAYNYLAGTGPVSVNGVSYLPLAETTFGVLAGTVGVYVALGLVGAVNLGTGIISIGLGGMINPLLSQLGYVIGALGASLVSIEAQGILLKFVSLTAMQILLPVGMVLRIAYVTRRLGGAMMAVAIGLFAVLPLTYVLNAELVAGYSTSLNSAAIGEFSLNTSATASTITSTAQQIGAANLTQVPGLVSSLVLPLEDFVKHALNFIAQLVIQVFFLPAFSLILTAVSIRELARLLGSEISFGRLYMM